MTRDDLSQIQVSTTDLAWLLGDISERRIQQLAREGKVAKAAHGLYWLAKSVQAHTAALAATAAGRGEEVEGLSSARTRLTQARAAQEERRNLEQQGDLVSVAEITPFWAAKTTATKSRVRAIPKLAVRRIKGFRAEMMRPLQEMIDEALSELSGTGVPPQRKSRGRVARRRTKAQPAASDSA